MLQELDFPLNILVISNIANAANITFLPIKSLFREMSKTLIHEIKATEMN